MKAISNKVYDGRLFSIFFFLISAWGVMVLIASIKNHDNLWPGIIALFSGLAIGFLIVYLFKPTHTVTFDPEKEILHLNNDYTGPIEIKLNQVVELYEGVNLDQNALGGLFRSRLHYILLIREENGATKKYKFQIISNQKECLKNFDLLRYYLLKMGKKA